MAIAPGDVVFTRAQALGIWNLASDSAMGAEFSLYQQDNSRVITVDVISGHLTGRYRLPLQGGVIPVALPPADRPEEPEAALEGGSSKDGTEEGGSPPTPVISPTTGIENEQEVKP